MSEFSGTVHVKSVSNGYVIEVTKWLDHITMTALDRYAARFWVEVLEILDAIKAPDFVGDEDNES